jgi:hypothetical protein
VADACAVCSVPEPAVGRLPGTVAVVCRPHPKLARELRRCDEAGELTAYFRASMGMGHTARRGDPEHDGVLEDSPPDLVPGGSARSTLLIRER